MIFETMEGLEDLLRIDRIEDYPQLENILMPLAEAEVVKAVGEEWVKANATDQHVRGAAGAMLAVWFEKPELIGEITPGINSMLTKLQARALEG
ncbi:MAG: hypothetical protein J6K55_12730 [Clostridia bacterium]|nr:hypothetical protein [Clostridia bacterium]